MTFPPNLQAPQAPPRRKGRIAAVHAAPAVAAHVRGGQVAGGEIREAARRVVDLEEVGELGELGPPSYKLVYKLL